MILVIGYGNPLRSDDGIGQRIATLMEQRLKHESLRVLTAYQLTPELVAPIREAQLVIFIDARVGSQAGIVLSEVVEPQTTVNGAFTHNVSPGILLGAAFELYGVKPSGVLISIVGADFDYGSELSEQMNRLLPEIADQVESIIKTNMQVAI
jgi:hydrogenase maturation protease